MSPTPRATGSRVGAKEGRAAAVCPPADLAQHFRSERQHLEEMRKLRKGPDICDSLIYTGLNIRSRTSRNTGQNLFKNKF